METFSLPSLCTKAGDESRIGKISQTVPKCNAGGNRQGGRIPRVDLDADKLTVGRSFRSGKRLKKFLQLFFRRVPGEIGGKG
jgi:hypothetical protein